MPTSQNREVGHPESLSEEGDDAGFEAFGGEGDQRDGGGEMEAAWACASGVEVEDVVAGLDCWLVGVAGDDGGDSSRDGADVEIVDGVDEVEELARDFDHLCGREIGAGAMDVDVAADGGDGSDGAQGIEDLDVADVPGVKDVLRRREGR